VPRREISDEKVEYPEKLFYLGQTVKCRVVTCSAVERKLILSFRVCLPTNCTVCVVVLMSHIHISCPSICLFSVYLSLCLSVYGGFFYFNNNVGVNIYRGNSNRCGSFRFKKFKGQVMVWIVPYSVYS